MMSTLTTVPTQDGLRPGCQTLTMPYKWAYDIYTTLLHMQLAALYTERSSAPARYLLEMYLFQSLWLASSSFFLSDVWPGPFREGRFSRRARL